MSDGTPANHWPSTDADAQYHRLTSLSDLGAIVERIRGGASTWEDRMALVDIATEIDRDAAGTELVGLADTLRRLAVAP